MITKMLYAFIAGSLFAGSVYGEYEIRTVNIDAMSGHTISNIYSSIPYDFSDIVNENQTIERLVLTVSADYTPGTGYLDGEYQTLSSDLYICNFDNYVVLLWQLLDQPLACEFEVDSEKMIGWRLHGHEGHPLYMGYSGNLQGTIDFSFFLNKTGNTVVENWSTLAINDATFTLYLVPEPATLLFFGLGGTLVCRCKKTRKQI